MNRPLRAARRAFYTADGPWRRRGLFEAMGSRRFSRPALHDMDRRLEQLLPARLIRRGRRSRRIHPVKQLLPGALPRLARPAGGSGARAFREGALAAARSIVKQAALVGPEQDGTDVVLHFGDLASTLGEPEHAYGGLRNAGLSPYQVTVRGRTLSGLLDETELGRPDLIVLDVEGYELAALRGLEDLDRHAPDLLVIEMLDMANQRQEFDALLGTRYQFARRLSEWDAVYCRRT
jgi:FkbM family methyltransferase